MTEEKTNAKPARQKTVLRRLTGIVGYVLIFLIAALFVFVIVFKANNRTVFIFGKAPVWVMTSSMEPTIPERSYILVKEVKESAVSEIKVGDVIMFASDDPALAGANNTHRVVEISEDCKTFITKGDANMKNDDVPVRAESIRAVYVRNMPVLTAAGRFMFSGIGTVITMTLIFAIMMAIYMPDIIKATRQKSKELEDKKQAKIEELVAAEVERLKRENKAVPETDVSDAEDAENAEETTDTTDDISVRDDTQSENNASLPETAERAEETAGTTGDTSVQDDTQSESNASAQETAKKEDEQ
ncbi:MAG: signal peptidase I [Clostridia bacterium]|nr:signal peptidase I [Clostridia bacterium]